MESPLVARARAFLASRRIAVVGVSRNEKDFTRMLFRALATRGHDLVPVNPGCAELEGRRCFARVEDVSPPPEAALLLTAPSRTDEVLRGCVAAGVRRVWLHRGGGPGAASPGALALCAANGIEVVHDLCPFMVLPEAGFGHRVHGFFRKRALARAHHRA